MHITKPLPVSILCSLLIPVFGQADQDRPSGLPPDQNVVAYTTRAEDAQRGETETSSPLIEGVFERFVPNELTGSVFDTDRYLLARFRWQNGPTGDDLLHHGSEKNVEDERLINGLASLMMPDPRGLDGKRYDYTFVRVELLGDVRCLVYDVSPKNTADDGFTGRVYIEDHSWNIVRFIGMSTQVDQLLATLRHENAQFRIDTWRMNIAKNRWVSALAYVQEVAPLGEHHDTLTKGQVRFWGYEKTTQRTQRSGAEVFLGDSAATEAGRAKRWNAPQESARRFEQEAEDNVIARLRRGNFLGPTGDVERVLDQVVTNLVITNKVTLGAPVHCRVLLTSRLEAFTIGNTIVLSRGLIDILPSESPIALVIAHQLAHIIIGHQTVDNQFAFGEVLRISDSELLAKLRFRHTPTEERAADKTALELLEVSPYANTMAEGGLAMQALQQHAQHLPGLIQPHFGEHIADVDHVVRNNDLFRTAPVLDDELPDQTAVLPLGAKLFVSPSDGLLELNRPERVVAIKVREKAGLTVTPFMPVLAYFAGAPSVPKSVATPAAARPAAARPKPAVQSPSRPVPRTPAVQTGAGTRLPHSADQQPFLR